MDPIYQSKKYETNEIIVEPCLAEGTALLKISLGKQRQKTFKIDIDQGQILWNSKKSGKINIESIEEIRVGDAMRSYREQFKLSEDIGPRWLTIIYVDFGKYKTLHLVAPTLELFNIWVENLNKLCMHRRDIIGGLDHLRKRNTLWLKQYWKEADKNGDSKLSFDDVAKLCNTLNISMSHSLLKAKFNEADENKNGYLDFNDFQRLVKLIKQRVELDKLFNSLAKERGNILTLREFKDFVVRCTLKEEEYDYLYYKFCDKDLKEMNLEGFSSFLMSSDNSIFAPEHCKVYQDMSQPLSHYFISSSHNTYLLGNQLDGKSSVEGYIRAFQEGSRCVEIDCWDGPDGPIVYHGYTLTTKIKFQDVISTIRTYAFKYSPYPIIISLEVHCSIEQQNQMASIIVNTLGECLVTKFLSENETELPSPEDLLYKIILKGVDTITDAKPESEVEADFKSPKALSNLIVYCNSVKFGGFDHDNMKFYEMFSLDEKASSKLLKPDKVAYIRHNIRHLTRIYPWGLRFDSSNYEPHHQWMVGNQLVSLNSQKFDLGMQINEAMFSVNGGCGYVLKPERLRNPNVSPDINVSRTLTIEIISAQQLPKDSPKGEVIDPFVEVELLVPGAEASKQKTSTISNNGFDPTWNKTFKFTFNYEEMSLIFLRFVVWDKDLIDLDDCLATYCIPLTSLQFGYRYVPLNDSIGKKYPYSTLFICSSLE
ncbi:1698_t:CDS:10 [Dentiscutata erythropus]|uniref:Phosphoinositide phospholipase C n=1 Tax=Dentiscutata erythropus TaxID=1348616 RepID=A0A9N9GZ65_9GLOM|nr:1698_t:CDS:10 [Dentiscutata erythropus]